MTVLLAEDDPELARQVTASLQASSHGCAVVSLGYDVLVAVGKGRFDAIILDVGLPGIDGFEVIRRLRANGSKTPVLFLTARDSVTDRVRGLSLGGDDYLTKPFASEELMARLEALHRRSQSFPGVKSFGRWTVDSRHRRLSAGDTQVTLQPIEWVLLEVLMEQDSRVVTKPFLLDKVWDIRFDPGTNVVDATICRLRKKIDAPGEPSHIETRRGKGYVFKSIP